MDTWLCFWFLVTIAFVSAAEIIIRPGGESFTKSIGSSMVMTCSVPVDASDGPLVLTWLDVNGVEIPSKAGRMYVESEDARTKKLYITSIQNNDAGQYTCTARGASVSLERSVRLLLFKEITFDDVPAVQSIAIDSDAVVICRTSGNPVPDVSWRFNGRRIQSDERYTLTADGLRIQSATLADEGDYTCRAEVEADGRYDERRIRVAVHVPPKIRETLQQADGVQGTDLYLSCKADGQPAPTYKFYKDGRLLLSTERVHIDAMTGVLYFGPVHKDDEGIYNCTSFNDVGSDSTSATLRVQVPPSIYSITNATVIEGQSATLVCLSQGDPRPDLSFFKTGQLLPYHIGQNSGNITVSSPLVGSLELTFRNAIPEDAGNYTCRSRNIVGTDEKQAGLTVQFRPRFSATHPRHTFAWAGKSRNVTCNVSSEPAAEIVWLHGGRLIEFNDTFRAYQINSPQQSIGFLQVHIREADQGWIYGSYTCRAKNFLGEAEISLDLKRASVPDAPQSVKVSARLPTELVLLAEPPEDDGGMPVTGYRVEYEDQVQDFQLDDVPLHIVGLKPSTNYILRVRAVSDVGAGTPVTRTEQTENIRRPYPIVISSSRQSMHPYEYTVTWQTPITGGLPITEYEFKYRRISVADGVLNFSVPQEDWTWFKVKDDINRPMLYYKLDDLESDSYYELEILAKNDLGTSDTNTPFVFSTAQGGDPEPVMKEATLDMYVIIAIIAIVLVVFLLIIDVSCYFMNNCGVTMFICVHMCGHHQHQPIDRGTGETESEKKPLSDEPPELESVAAYQPSHRTTAHLHIDDDVDERGSGSSIRDPLNLERDIDQRHAPSDMTDNDNSIMA